MPRVSPKGEGEKELGTYFTNFRKGGASTPFENRIHQLHLEALNILIGYEGYLAFSGHSGNPTSDFLHAPKRLRESLS
jgi:hypothetical protein